MQVKFAYGGYTNAFNVAGEVKVSNAPVHVSRIQYMLTIAQESYKDPEEVSSRVFTRRSHIIHALQHSVLRRRY